MNVAEAKAKIAEAKRDPLHKGFPMLLRIKDKQGALRPFEPNVIQEKVARNMTDFTLVDKPRRDGVTSLGNALGFWQMMQKTGQDVLALNLNKDTTEKMFDRVRTFFDNWPAWMKTKPERDNVQKLQLAHGSSFDAWSIKAGMGREEADKLGRSFNCNFFHGTECAFWEWYREILNGLQDTLPEGARILLESTGNGAQGGFYEDFIEIIEKGDPVEGEPGVYRWGNRTAIFLAWFENPERRLAADPFSGEALDSKARYYLKESELEHLQDMKAYGVSGQEATRALYWRRTVLKKKGFFRDPVGAIKNTDREYPGNYRHSFQTSGHAFLSLTLTDTLRESWKTRNKLHPPLQIGLIEDGRGGVVVDPRESWLTVWEAPVPGWKNRYAVGGDVGGGHEDGDRDFIGVKDRVANKQVAVMHDTVGPQEWARRALLVAKWYGARLAFETNNHGTAVQVKIFESGYSDVYRHDDTAEAHKGLGWLTTEKSRREGLDHLKLAYEDQADPLQIPFLEFYTEAAAFAAAPGKTRPEGQGGVHDDVIMGTMVMEMCSLSMPAPERIREVPTYTAGQVGGMKAAVARPPQHSTALRNY